jgi:hypothetical protein
LTPSRPYPASVAPPLADNGGGVGGKPRRGTRFESPSPRRGRPRPWEGRISPRFSWRSNYPPALVLVRLFREPAKRPSPPRREAPTGRPPADAPLDGAGLVRSCHGAKATWPRTESTETPSARRRSAGQMPTRAVFASTGAGWLAPRKVQTGRQPGGRVARRRDSHDTRPGHAATPTRWGCVLTDQAGKEN